MTTNPGGQEHVQAARTPEERIRLLLKLTDYPNLGDEITYDRRFNTEAWPRNGYCLQRSDLEAVLKRVGDLEEENALQRQDLEDAQNQIEDLKTASDEVNAMRAGWSEKRKELEESNRKLRATVLSLKANGAEHWFSYGYQEDTNGVRGAQGWEDFCKVCNKSKGDPSHFGNGVTALSSAVVEEAVEAVRKRLEAFLAEGTGLDATVAHSAAQELMKGLPGIPGPKEDGS